MNVYFLDRPTGGNDNVGTNLCKETICLKGLSHFHLNHSILP